MDKKSKDPMRRYKKSRHAAHSSSESTSSETDTGSSSSYTSTDSEHNRINERHRKKKGSRRVPSSSGEDNRRKRDKRDHCQKKLEAKRNHIKRKLKEAKLKKRAAAALSGGHGSRSLTPTTQAKLKKLAERKHLRAASKERREREKIRNAQRERERDHHRISRSPPTTTTKIRIHQDVKHMKSPGMGGNGGSSNNGGGSSSSSSRMHHQLMSREKIIIQTRTRDRTPSLERERERLDRQRHEHKQQQRHDELSIRERERRDRERERAEREAARDKERAEALARCQERQRERERIAREKMRREEEEKKYGDVGSSGLGGNRMRQLSERNIEMNGPYGSRERSLEGSERSRHMSKRDLDPYDREPPEYIESDRHSMFDEVRRYGSSGGGGGGGGGSVGSGSGAHIISSSSISGHHHHRRREISPAPEHYQPRLREPSRDLYPEDNREHVYKRNYAMEARYPSRDRESWHSSREMRDHELHDARDFRDAGDNHYVEERERERERLIRERESEREREHPAPSRRNEWKGDWERNDWDESGGGSATPGRSGGFVGGPKRGLSKHHHQAPSNVQQVQIRAGSESNWDTDEQDSGHTGHKPETSWLEHEPRERPRHWQNNDWRDQDDGYSVSSGGRGGSESGMSSHMPHQQSAPGPPHHMPHPRSERGGRGFRRGGGHSSDHLVGERGSGYRPHPPPLMTLPVQPPGGYHSGGGGMSTRGFPHKRHALTYTNPGYGKKHMHSHSSPAAGSAAAAAGSHIQQQQRKSPQPSNTSMKPSSTITSSSTSSAQASAVAAATTAVAAAKAAAQSSANATTNPGILGKVSKVHATSSNSYSHDPDSIEAKTSGKTTSAVDDKLSGGELSEISDSDDEILNKTEKVRDELADVAEPFDSQMDIISTEESKSESTGTGNGNALSASTITSSSSTSPTPTTAAAPETASEPSSTTAINENKATDDSSSMVLDFEEISDGELEEDGRIKGISEAIGIEWKALIALTREHKAQYVASQKHNRMPPGKMAWQPHHIYLNVGVSLKMAGTYYGQQLLNESRLLYKEEQKEMKRLEKLRVKAEKKEARKAARAAAKADAEAAAMAEAEAEAATAAAVAAASADGRASADGTTSEAIAEGAVEEGGAVAATLEEGVAADTTSEALAAEIMPDTSTDPISEETTSDATSEALSEATQDALTGVANGENEGDREVNHTEHYNGNVSNNEIHNALPSPRRGQVSFDRLNSEFRDLGFEIGNDMEHLNNNRIVDSNNIDQYANTNGFNHDGDDATDTDTDNENDEDVPHDVKDENEDSEEEPFVSSVAEPLACVQIALRTKTEEFERLMTVACGPHHGAFSARADLHLRRQLCGLPANECLLPPKVNGRLKEHALYLFQKRSMSMG